MPSLRHSSRFLVVFTTLILIDVAVSPLSAQEPSSDLAEPAHISFIDGTATLEREGESEIAALNAPLVSGDRLSTMAGRVELLFPDGSSFGLDEYSSAEVLAPSLIRLLAGRAMLAVVGVSAPSAAVRFRVDTPVASVGSEGPGEFRVAVFSDAAGDQTELAVVRGSASFETERGSLILRAGKRSIAYDDRAPSAPQSYNSARFDDFDRWFSARRAERVALVSRPSAQYLPAELRSYGGTLDRHGSWQYMAPYGYVWYPVVGVDWRPYYYGSWSSVPTYGWTWVGVDVWAWPTHHYGRWGHRRGSWFWIPGRRWATSWVSWASTPDYVSWCPLGFDGQPVFGLSVGVVSPWSSWVVVPRTSFGGRSFYASRHSVRADRLPRSTSFQRSSPPAPVRSMARANFSGAPSTGVAVPRSPRSPEPSGSVVGRRAPHEAGVGSRPVAPRAPTPSTVDGSSREFRRPLPSGAYRSPSASPGGVYRSPAERPGARPAVPSPAVPRAPSAEAPRYRYGTSPGTREPAAPRESGNEGPRYYRGTPLPTPREQGVDGARNRNTVPPVQRVPEAEAPRYRAPRQDAPTPAQPQAVPRWNPQSRERGQGSRPYEAPPSYAPPARAPERAPEVQRPAYGSGGGTREPRSRGAPPSNGDSRAVPRGEGSHQGRRR